MADNGLIARGCDVVRRIVRWKWFGLLNSIFVFALLFYVITRRLDGLDLYASLAKARVKWLAAGVLTTVATILATALRTRDVLQRESGQSIGFASVARLQFVGLFMTFALPISIFGDVARAGMFHRRYYLSLETAVRVVVFDRILGALGIVMVGLLTFSVQLLFKQDVRSLESFELTTLGVAIVFIAVLVALARSSIEVRIRRLQLLLGWMSTLGRLFHDPGFVVRQSIFAVLYVGAVGVTLLFLGWGFDDGVTPLVLVAFTPVILFVNNLPFLYVGWGGRELIVVVTLSGIGGMPAREALLLSIAYGLAVVVASLPGVFFWMTRPTFRKAYGGPEALASECGDGVGAPRRGP